MTTEITDLLAYNALQVKDMERKFIAKHIHDSKYKGTFRQFVSEIYLKPKSIHPVLFRYRYEHGYLSVK